MTQTVASPRVQLIAPISGILVPIELVPDPVFAKKMVGDGLSIDPLSDVLVAPIDGEVINVQPAMHAVTIRSADGLEVLLHIGLDTVRMGGKGFQAKVRQGQQVRVGEELIAFDMDTVAEEALSLLTQVVVTNSDAVSNLVAMTGTVVAGRDVVAEITLAEAGDDSGPIRRGRTVRSDAILIPNPTGLHARPAATLVALAKKFDSEVTLRRGDDTANAKSIMSIMSLSAERGDKVFVSAHGPDAEQAVTEVAEAIRNGLGEEVTPLTEAEVAEVEAEPAAEEVAVPVSGDPNLLLGVAASPGLAVGQVVQLRHEDIGVAEFAPDKHLERRKLNTAIDRALLDLSALQGRLEKEADPENAAIFAAHAEILQDPDLLDIASSAIEKGNSAPFAWRGAYQTYAERLSRLKNEILAGRANDVRDVGQRVLEELTGHRREKPELPENTILIAEDLTPSDTATLDRRRVVGFATTSGGASSHVAIIARSLDIPAVAGIEGRALGIAEGTRVVLDGGRGSLQLNLTDDQIDAIVERQRRIAAKRVRDLERAGEPAITSDGHQVQVVANIGNLADAQQAMTVGAEGVGLLRSEFVFLGRQSAPSEDEQAELYADIAGALRPGQPLVIRTLDVGGDKPLPYLPIPAEENPFLGIRGVRVGFDRPEVLRTQCRAIIRAADAGAELYVMFPMIATIDDWRFAKQIWDAEVAALGSGGDVKVGIMMEVPSVGVMANQFAAEDVAFFSVGTNDLTSYTLAMDRGHPKLAAQVDPCNPSVLQLIGQAGQALHAAGKWLGVCGSIASDPQAVPILLGLGVDELSCSIPAIPAVKAAVRSYSLDQCRRLAAKAVACSTPAEVRALVPVDEG
ncbi:MAG: phosphoenolpyruvate--protein phosphotransferase [Brooklawnia sp.]|uniref:phosphoenolpyruvate--protein phosphotransferase n=1 Tax=Brooklawnia sp. TaxID=2699740 RepID=UPI003C71AFF7